MKSVCVCVCVCVCMQKLNLVAVESRIKTQVAADRAVARQRTLAMQRGVLNVFKAPEGPAPLRDTLLEVRVWHTCIAGACTRMLHT